MKKVLYMLILFPASIFAQQNVQMNREWGLEYERQLNLIHSSHSSSVNTNDTIGKSNISHQFAKADSVSDVDLSCFKPYITKSKFSSKDKSKGTYLYRKFREESFVVVNDTADKFRLNIDPLFNFQFGIDRADTTGEKLYTNTRGFMVRGGIGNKFAFETSFYENQSTFPRYLDSYIATTTKLFPQPVNTNENYAVIPGQGRSKPFKKNGYDYAMASGYVSYTPNKYFNFQIGNGKNFIGDGYRSLLLSDNAFNYPYARITTTYKNIQYTNLYTSFMNLTDGGVTTPAHVERLFQKKVGSFQLLSMNFFKRLQVGLFQGMIWEAADSTNHQHVNFNTFDPVIGVNTLNYGLHNTNNIVLGATIKIKFTNSISIFGQGMLDDVNIKNDRGDKVNKYGYQIGIKYFDLFTIKNLHLQLEYISVRPYSYSSTNPEQSYTHYNQSLAHPLGANFYEAVGFINYRFNNFFVELKGNYAVKGADSLNFNFGSNVFKSDNAYPISQNMENVQTTQGLKTTIVTEDIHIGYLLNKSSNFNIVFGVSNRTDQTDRKTNNTQWVYVGVRTSLTNLYYDF
ncbi:MAG: hypothetical protein WCP52_01605 [Bacteroidota bacterium]